jgi:hypothetical protein
MLWMVRLRTVRTHVPDTDTLCVASVFSGRNKKHTAATYSDVDVGKTLLRPIQFDFNANVCVLRCVVGCVMCVMCVLCVCHYTAYL